MKTKSLVCAALAATSALLVSAVQAKQLKVLMIGNSFSICVLKEMPACAASAGETLDLASLYIGGCPLDRHWENVEKAGDPNFKPYGFSYSYASVKDAKDDGMKLAAGVLKSIKVEGKGKVASLSAACPADDLIKFVSEQKKNLK